MLGIDLTLSGILLVQPTDPDAATGAVGFVTEDLQGRLISESGDDRLIEEG